MIVNILAVMFVQTYLYQYYYYTGFAAKSSADFNDGMIEAFEEVNKIKAENPDIIQVMFTSNYGQPYIYGLFVNKISPQDYQWGAQRYYWWADNIEVSDLFRKNNIIVASAEDDMPLEDAKKIIYGSDGEPRFIIYMGK